MKIRKIKARGGHTLADISDKKKKKKLMEAYTEGRIQKEKEQIKGDLNLGNVWEQKKEKLGGEFTQGDIYKQEREKLAGAYTGEYIKTC